ncbi:MAG TPA: pseudouridine-5'-phosphate glycosidase [Actinomycetota bacterium]|jgi:pseudouridine-5'-phosphate glycosidase
MSLVQIDDEVGQALREGRAVVALETSVLSQGLPHPRNLDAARDMAGRIRSGAAVPAWIAVKDGRIRVGLTEEEIEEFADPRSNVAKVARRDYPAAVAGGGLGATTVSATLWASHRAGIDVMATGGIGGVHPGSGDVSADLLEMARVPGFVVCSGPKSIVDPAATLERLEELGILVAGYGVDRLPFFLSTTSGLELEHRADTPADAAALARARRDLGVETAVLLCNPIPADRAMDAAAVAQAVAACEAEAERRGVRGKDVTPFLLSCLAERTGGASLEANLSLLSANAALAAEVARALAV